MSKNKKFRLIMLIALNLALLILISDFSKVESYAINLGENGSRIAELQKSLKEKGYYSGEINGLYDFSTRKAVMNYETANGIDKKDDHQTFSMLGLYNTESGCYGSDTELLAKHLKHNGIIEYHYMVEECERILINSENISLCRYIIDTTDDINRYLNEKPNSEQYSAAVSALKRRQNNPTP